MMHSPFTLILFLKTVLGFPCISQFRNSKAIQKQTTWQVHVASASSIDTSFATSNPTPQELTNFNYPILPFDNYLANPFFAKINTDYPGLQLIHEEPFIFIVNDFFTPDECSRLREKARDRLRPQIGGGSVTRTSSGVVCVNEEVPSIRAKMQLLTSASDDMLQPLKVSRYQPGQTFSKHTDAWPTEGAPISKGWVNEPDFFGDLVRPTQGCFPAHSVPNQNTLMTCFVYLNDVPGSGHTTFPNIGLHQNMDGTNFYECPQPMDSSRRPDGSAWDWEYRTATEPLRVEPKLGMAVVHFCSTIPEHGGICDGNTFHIADPPADGSPKYVSQQFVASCPKWRLPDDSLPYGRVSWDTI